MTRVPSTFVSMYLRNASIECGKYSDNRHEFPLRDCLGRGVRQLRF
jgi:hypothetical protein